MGSRHVSGCHGGGRRGTKALESTPVTDFLHRVDNILLRLMWVPRVMLLVAFLLIVYQAADRKPPFEILNVEPASARAGETITITARVWRDTERDCSASMTRSIFDSTMARSDYAVTYFSDQVIDKMERKTPGVLRVSLVLPANASSGPANLVSVLHYRCNRVHAVWPIEVTTNMPFEVLP